MLKANAMIFLEILATLDKGVVKGKGFDINPSNAEATLIEIARTQRFLKII